MSSAEAWPVMVQKPAPAPTQAPAQGPEPAPVSSQLLLTKLYLPPVSADLVPRPRLLNQMAAGVQGSLTLVCAPAGFGKTSLFCAWRSSAEGEAYRLAWLSLDADDDEPRRFLEYLAAALETAMPGAFGQVTVLFRLPQLPPVKTVLAAILNCVAMSLQGPTEGAGAARPGSAERAGGCTRPLVLALDDYHLIENPAIHEAVEYLLDHLPPCLRIVILSRSDPPLRLARLRARGQLTEIRAGDLRFTTEESTQFLNDVMRLGLEPADIAALDARTEGWIVGLKLAALRLAQPGLSRQEAARFIRTFETNHRFAAEFLVEEVISRQPEQVQEFVLRSSILERFSAPLCDELLRALDEACSGDCTGHGSLTPLPSEGLIEHLVRRNLFVVPLDEEGYWYRYHHLLRDLLRARLAKLQPGNLPALHRAAAGWFESQGLLKEAVKHAILTQNWDYAADMVERHFVTTLGRSEVRTLAEWSAAFPENVMRRRPALCIMHAWVLHLSFDESCEPAFFSRCEQAEAAVAAASENRSLPDLAPLAPGRPPIPLRSWVPGNTMQLRAAHMLWPSVSRFDPQTLIDMSRQSMALLADAGDGVTDSVNFLNFAYSCLALPDVQGAEEALAEARRRTIGGRNYYGGVTAVYYQALLALLRGGLDQVDPICAQGRAALSALVDDVEQNLPAIRCLDLARGCALLEQNELDRAEQLLTSALALFGWAPWIEVTGYIALARLRRARGDRPGLLSALGGLERFGPHERVCARGLQVFAQLQAFPGDRDALAAASEWAKSVRPDGNEAPTLGIYPPESVLAYAIYLAWAGIMLMLGDTRPVVASVEPALVIAQDQGLMTRVIELSLVEAQACNVLGESRKSWDALERALVLAERSGHLRTFDQGERIKELLAEAAARGLRRQQIRRILDVIGWPEAPEPAQPAAVTAATARAGEGGNGNGNGRGSSRSSVGPTDRVSAASMQPPDECVEPVSERELEVLDLIAGGLSNAEIAARLYIGIGTVKTHVNHLFGKLDASSRTQLLARARLAGLLGEQRS